MTKPLPDDFPCSTARPTGSAFAWANADGIFVEIPSATGGVPSIIRYHRTAEGLRQALNILLENPAPRNLTTTGRKLPKVDATDAQREAALATLRKLGIV